MQNKKRKMVWNMSLALERRESSVPSAGSWPSWRASGRMRGDMFADSLSCGTEVVCVCIVLEEESASRVIVVMIDVGGVSFLSGV